MSSPRCVTAALYGLFFLSGAAGLIYQVVWMRLLQEVFGVTVYAVTTVLATFLGGLALGGFGLGGLADRAGDPLRVYGWLEIGVGVTGLLGTLTVHALEPVHVWAANRFAPDSAMLIGARAALAALVILPPTFLMGGTLPAMTRAVVRHIRHLGRQLSLLYALNTLGAVSGTLAAGFVLIRALGLHTTLRVAVAINLAVGLASLRLAGTRRPAADDAGARPGAAAVSSAAGALLVVVALSGVAALGLEVLWSRILVLVIGTSTYAFVTMLASFLVGITGGSYLSRLIVDRVEDPRRTFGWIQLGIGASTLATLPVLRAINTGATERWLEAFGHDWVALVAGRFAVSFLVMLVPTTLMGMAFPLAGKLCAREDGSLGARLGQLYGANTLGNILGAALTGFVLVAAIGLQKAIALLAGLNQVSAAWGLWPPLGTRRRWPDAVRAAPALAGIAFVALLALRWQPPPFEVEDQQRRERLLYYKEDAAAVVSVYQDRQNRRQRSMLIDGVTIGTSYRGVDEKQQALAHFPFLLMPETPLRRVLSIGLGTGILVGEVAKHESIQAIDCVEISPSVIEAARLFSAFNDNVLENPVVRVVNDDGVNFLRRIPDRYDAIIADEKSRTGHAGNAVFFSADYYRLCHDHLAPSGLMIQWVPLDVPPAELRVIFRSFLSVFPCAYVWLAPPLSGFLVGSQRPLVLDVPLVERVLEQPAFAHLRRYGWRDAYGFLSLLTADAESLRRGLAPATPLNTLERPVLEFYSPRAYTVSPARRIAENLKALLSLRTDPLGRVKLLGADAATLASYDRAAVRLIEASAGLQAGQPTGLPLLEEALAMAPGHGPLRYAAARAYVLAGQADQSRDALDAAIALYRLAVKADPESVEAHGNLGSALLLRQQFEQARMHYEEALRLNPDDAKVHYGLGVALALQDKLAEAIDHFDDALRIDPEYPEARDALARALLRGDRTPRAR